MKSSYLIKKNYAEKPPVNIFTNKSALVLHTLLNLNDKEFQIREIARSTSISHGLVQRIVSQLVNSGIIQSSGQRTAKKYTVVKSGKLLNDWILYYSVIGKCTVYNYKSAYSISEVERILKADKKNKYTLALHAASRAYKCSYTNLSTLELYIDSDKEKSRLEKKLHLEPQETGYQILLMKPYYKSILSILSVKHSGMMVSSPILTFLDLYDFPLRGREQAMYFLKKHPSLSNLYKSFKNEQ